MTTGRRPYNYDTVVDPDLWPTEGVFCFPDLWTEATHELYMWSFVGDNWSESPAFSVWNG